MGRESEISTTLEIHRKSTEKERQNCSYSSPTPRTASRTESHPCLFMSVGPFTMQPAFGRKSRLLPRRGEGGGRDG
jgi:hypothetical protein